MKTSKRISPIAAASFLAIATGAVLGLTLSGWFLLLAAAGAFVPGIARRLGWLKDMDEFAIAAQNSAAWAAFATTIAAASALFAAERGGIALDSLKTGSDQILVLMILGFTVYAAAYLFRYWDGKKAAILILAVFGSGLALFIVLSEWQSPMALLMEALVLIVPIALILVAGRFLPVLGGILSLAAAVGATIFFGIAWGHDFNLPIIVILIIPLVISGIGFLQKRRPAGA
jgi:hypothetical protein